MSKPYDQGAPPQYPQSPPPAHYDAGPAPQPGYYNNRGDAPDYGASPNPYQQQGQPGLYGPPGQNQYGLPQGQYGGQPGYGQPGQMQYQQGPPPPGGYYQDNRGQQGGGGGGGGLFAGLCAGLACCCCLDCLF